MQAAFIRHARKLTLGVAALLFSVAVIAVLLAALIDAGFFHGPILRWMTARAGRPLTIGSLEFHLLSRHPGVAANDISIGNPPWVAPGQTAHIGRFELHWDLSTRLHRLEIGTIDVRDASFDFVRDADGKSNWTAHPPGSGPSAGPPLMRHLNMPQAHVKLRDARRHLDFDGAVSIGENPERALGIDAKGQLNGRPVRLAINGDPLSNARRGTPYHFDFDETSSGSRLTGTAVLPKPFDFHELDAHFSARGEDLKDLYFLTGVTLPNTGTYQLTGDAARRDRVFRYSQLVAKSGDSDLRGAIDIETRGGHAQIHADLHSERLRSADLGARAAGRGPDAQPGAKPGDTPQRVFPDTRIPLKGIRAGDAVIEFHAKTFELGRLPLHDVATRVTIKQHKLVAAPFAARFASGTVQGRGELDATLDPPRGRIELSTRGMELADLGRSAEPPASGSVQARADFTGRGRSLREFAAGSDGTLTAVVPHGMIRASLAEMSGIDLQGLGLALSKSKRETDIRCAVASFTAHSGVLDANHLVIDTEPVLIDGKGSIDMRDEQLNLSFKGNPKHPRLRVRAPVMVQGSLLHPSFSVGARQGLAQAGAAVALGVVLTPLASVLAFVDPGLAKDQDCAALIDSTTRVGTKP